MSLMNAQFGKLLRFYALKHAREALAPTEQVEQAKLTQLTFDRTYTEDEILGWKVKELKAALKGAGLPVSGLKKVLQQRALENLL